MPMGGLAGGAWPLPERRRRGARRACDRPAHRRGVLLLRAVLLLLLLRRRLDLAFRFDHGLGTLSSGTLVSRTWTASSTVRHSTTCAAPVSARTATSVGDIEARPPSPALGRLPDDGRVIRLPKAAMRRT